MSGRIKPEPVDETATDHCAEAVDDMDTALGRWLHRNGGRLARRSRKNGGYGRDAQAADLWRCLVTIWCTSPMLATGIPRRAAEACSPQRRQWPERFITQSPRRRRGRRLAQRRQRYRSRANVTRTRPASVPVGCDSPDCTVGASCDLVI